MSDPSATALAPGLLLAAPRLDDPNSEHSVVLLGHHDDGGALGWVLNGRVLAPVAELLRQAGLVPGGVELPSTESYDASVRLGGPVMPGSVWLLYPLLAADPEMEGVQELPGGYAITCARPSVEAVARGDGPSRFRLLLGYAGWAPGQLEEEIQAGAWLPASLETELLDASPEALWDLAYRRAIGVPPGAFGGPGRGSA